MWTPSCAMHPTPLGTPPPRGLIVRPLAHDDRFTTAELDLLEECAVERYTIGAAVDAASAQRRAVALRRQLQDETPDVLHQTAQDVCLDGAAAARIDLPPNDEPGRPPRGEACGA